MDDINWSLVDAEKRAALFPEFEIPPTDERNDIRTGYLCKLIFQLDDISEDGDGPEGERMWVKVTSSRNGKRYAGRLMNDPVVVSGIKEQDLIEFGPQHIISIDEE